MAGGTPSAQQGAAIAYAMGPMPSQAGVYIARAVHTAFPAFATAFATGAMP